MINYKVDLTNCDREHIHIPGKVQSHGFLVAIDSTFTINYISDNLYGFLPTTAASLLGKNVIELERLLLTEETGFITQMVQLGRHVKSFDTINPYRVNIGDDAFNLIISASGNCYLLEFEPVSTAAEVDIQKTIGRSVSEMLTGKNLKQLLNNAAEQIKTLIGYDRIMIYKFLDDGHGEVIAEVKEDHLEPFLGLHYPASDIPKQARDLYKINLTRIISDVNTESSPILTIPANDGTSQPLDLTHSALRAVSPIHIQYLKNMGVASSFSISLLYRDELWGLIACHNYTPRFINYKAREASKLIGQIISSALEYKQDEENNARSREYRTIFETLSADLHKGGDIADAITARYVTFKDVTDATGAVLIFEDQIKRIGETPNDDQLTALIDWLQKNMEDRVYHTNQLPEVYYPAKAYHTVASGLLAINLSKEMGEFMLWFKPEQRSTIQWAGNPEKPVEPDVNGLMNLSPRHSFEVWSQTVQYTSARWTREEIAAVLKLREEVMFAINRQASAIRTLNEKLKHAYEELDTFSFTVSHDLRTPLSTIKNYSELLLESNNSLDDDARRILKKVIAGADKLNFLIKEVLNYSRVGRADIESVDIDMANLINELKTDLVVAFNVQDIEFTIGDTPSIFGDKTMITQVFSNLLNNAVKYSARSKPPKVKVEGSLSNNEIIYSISDNGIGIDINYFNRIFDLFKRMDNVRDYEGTGVGLAIVKRIIDKHNARIWVESELGIGTIFYVAFKRTV